MSISLIKSLFLQLSDTTHFRIVSAAADSAVIEALAYNKPQTDSGSGYPFAVQR
jgi:hypothetical protein